MSNSVGLAIRKPSWLAAHKPIAWVCFPIVSLAIVVIGILVFEAYEERRFQARVQQMRAEGTPVDRASLAALIRARTRSEGVVAWSEIHVIQQMLSQTRQRLPSRTGLPEDNELYRALFLDTKHPDEENIAEYLEKLRPFFRSVENAVKLPKPVTTLERIDGSMVLGFDEAQSELRLELMHALSHRQVERATTAMDLMFQVCDAQFSDKESQSLVGKNSYLEKRIEYSAITRSLCANLWDEAYLRFLMERIQDDGSLDLRWRSSIVRNRALGLDEFPRFTVEQEFQMQSSGARSGIRFFPFPRNWATGPVKNFVLDGCLAYESIASKGLSQLVSKADEVNKKYFGTSNNGNVLMNTIPHPFRQFEYESNGWIHLENQRRMARTALAVKLFQIKNGEWPKGLDALSEVDFSAGESQTVNGEKFGYEVDGDSAYVWKHQIYNKNSNHPRGWQYVIASNLRSIKSALESIDGADLVRIR
jgi:hypothetical protein